MIPVSIAFLDIDKFKDFNSEVGETHVDRHVLPVFMRAVEAHIYGHGFAYRFGGDEYALLMPNADADLACLSSSGTSRECGLMEHGLRFARSRRKITITVSVGLCVADRDCHLTDGELLQKGRTGEELCQNGREGSRGRIHRQTVRRQRVASTRSRSGGSA